MTLSDALNRRLDPEALTPEVSRPIIRDIVGGLALGRHAGGWADWTDDDIERNYARFLAVLERKLICARCPGPSKCKVGRVEYTRMRPVEAPAGHRSVELSVGRCRESRVVA